MDEVKAVNQEEQAKHQQVGQYLLSHIGEMQIPAKEWRNIGAIEEWLGKLASGKFLIIEPEIPKPAGKAKADLKPVPNEGDEGAASPSK